MYRKENNKSKSRVILRPATSGETGLFYALSNDLDEKLGTVGHLRIDFGSNGHEFWHTWWHVIMKDHIALLLNPI